MTESEEVLILEMLLEGQHNEASPEEIEVMCDDE
jgi:hypothetical protein